MWLLLLVCVLAGACGFDFRSAFVDYGLVFCVGGGVAAVEGIIERSAKGFSSTLGLVLMCFPQCNEANEDLHECLRQRL